jgi:putative ABC transport system ATP-binding protein
MDAAICTVGDDPSALSVRVRGLDHAFGDSDARTQVLHDIDLDIKRGEFIVLRGASGSGKTTLLTLIAGLRSIQHGDVTVLGQALGGASQSTLSALRERLGFIFQSHNLHESLTAMQNVRMGIEIHGQASMAHWDMAARHLLGLLGLEDRLHAVPAKLSGGQKQRVAIARALVGNPEIVFADEPTAALDAENGLRVVHLLRALGKVRGTTTLMVTHDARMIEHADRVLTMDNGRIVSVVSNCPVCP